MNFVLDSSLALAFVFEDEATLATDEFLDSFGKGARAAAPALWRWEVANVLFLAERRNRISRSQAQEYLMLLRRLPVEIDETALEEAWSTTLLLAQKHRLTCYDAAYLEVALRRGIALGSLDRELRAASKSEKLTILPETV